MYEGLTEVCDKVENVSLMTNSNGKTGDPLDDPSCIRNIVLSFGVSRIVAASSRFASIFRKIPPIRI